MIGRRKDRDSYARLQCLYEVSRQLTLFESVEKAFPEIFSIAASSLPIASAVLVEQLGDRTRTTIWPTTGLSEEKSSRALAHARTSYSYLMDRSDSQAAALQAAEPKIAQLHGSKFKERATSQNRQDFLALPLVIEHGQIFGVIQLEVSESPREVDLQFANTVVNLLAVALDRHRRIEAEREAQQADTEDRIKQLNRTKEVVNDLEAERGLRETFVASLSHDLRTPLTAARISAELISKQPEKEELSRILSQRIMNDIDRVDQMIRDLLDANRIRSGQELLLDIRRCELRATVSRALETLKGIHGDRLLLVAADDPIWGYWNCDAIQRIVDNLVTNAVKYGSRQHPITCTLQLIDSHVRIAVHNEGVPISPHDQTLLFQRFQRASSAQIGGEKGWGLGLALVRGFAEAHGGRAWFESDASRGTTFTVELPRDARASRNSRSA